MKNKLTGRQIRLLICLIVVAIFSLSYQYIYTRFEDLADSYSIKTKSTNQLIRQRQDDLAKEEEYKAKTEEMTKNCEAIIDAYPVNITKEDDLIFMEKLEKALNITIPSSNISIADNTEVYQTILPIRDKDGKEILDTANSPSTATADAAVTASSGVTDTSAAGSNTVASSDTTNTSNSSVGATNTTAGNTATITQTELTNTPANNTSPSPDNSDNTTQIGSTGDTTVNTSGQQYMKVLQSRITITFQTTNRDFRKMVDYLNQYPEKISIADASLSYDNSTGELMANITINRYALTGTGKVYEEPYIGDISIGTKDLFGTASLKKKNKKEE